MAFRTTRLHPCRIGIAAIFVIALLSVTLRAQATTLVSMAWSPVGNPGNAADPLTGYGAVNYAYSIGTNDVTNSQYVAFLNANDPTGADPLALFNGNMALSGIKYAAGNANGTKYSVIPIDGNYPVNYVSWYDAIRFANWMDDGQPIFASEPTAMSNATENGSYTLMGYAPTPSNANSITRNSGAIIALPSENEWYKAAYYNPVASSYYLYPTASNTVPQASSPTATPDSSNYSDVVGYLTNIGVYTGTTSPYGAFDMGGDVYQWNEALIGGQYRGIRGGSYFDVPGSLESSYRDADTNPALIGLSVVGFRLTDLASVPEPSTAVLALLACGIVWWCRKRFKRCPA